MAPALGAVVDAWLTLPKALKAGILAMVLAADMGADRPSSQCFRYFDVSELPERRHTHDGIGQGATAKNIHCPVCGAETWDDGIDSHSLCDVCIYRYRLGTEDVNSCQCEAARQDSHAKKDRNHVL